MPVPEKVQQAQVDFPIALDLELLLPAEDESLCRMQCKMHEVRERMSKREAVRVVW